MVSGQEMHGPFTWKERQVGRGRPAHLLDSSSQPIGLTLKPLVSQEGVCCIRGLFHSLPYPPIPAPGTIPGKEQVLGTYLLKAGRQRGRQALPQRRRGLRSPRPAHYLPLGEVVLITPQRNALSSGPGEGRNTHPLCTSPGFS